MGQGGRLKVFRLPYFYYKIAIRTPIWPYGNYFALTGVSMLNKEVELTQ